MAIGIHILLSFNLVVIFKVRKKNSSTIKIVMGRVKAFSLDKKANMAEILALE
ncbi:MAG: hypothetical protein WCL14_09385 [Bacteroidota bacterium]